MSRNSLLVPGGPDRTQQIQDAKAMSQYIERNAKSSGTTVPPYEFLELIGKGAFGRVYKCRNKKNAQLVAVKILNIDDADFAADPRERDETVKDFRKEVETLRQLKDYRAKNVNLIHDAFDLHSQLWIISDYCTGGSVRTLMRASPHHGLEDKFLIPIARELAIAMKSVHDLGVIHRDIKCANVYVTEDGRIQLGDFGVVGIMDNGVAKRTTIIGTPWYMPREMHVDSFSVQEGYGKEVDIWAYGCTLYEMATGSAPNADVTQNMLGMVLEQEAPRLEGDRYSDSLRAFVSFCLNSDPAARPNADAILKHPYIYGTEQSHPTQTLVTLIDRYIVWEHKGGVRASLFNPGGAAAPARLRTDEDDPGEDEFEDGDWTFNTSESFYGAFAKRHSQMLMGSEDLDLEFEAPAGAGLPPARPLAAPKSMTPFERIQREHAAKSADRGERSLDRIWNPEANPYDVNAHEPAVQEPISDLPLREYSSDSAPRESTVFIDLDAGPTYDNGPAFNFDFDNIPTVKAKQRSILVDEDDMNPPPPDANHDDKRSTMAWQFPKADVPQQKRATLEWAWPVEQASIPLDPETALDLPVSRGDDGLPAGFRPKLKHTATEPVGQFNDFIHSGKTQVAEQVHKSKASLQSLIDLSFDLSGGASPSDILRPPTAGSFNGSISTTLTAGPFDLETDSDFQDRDQNRKSHHKPWQSEGGHGDRASLRHIPLHFRGASLSSTDSERERMSGIGSRPPTSDFDMRGFHDGMPPALTSHPAPLSDHGSLKMFTDDDQTTTISIPDTPSQFSEFTFPSTNTSFSTNMPNSARIRSDTVEFPDPMPPSAESLMEHAASFTVMAEMSRLLADASNAFKGTALAMDIHFGHLSRQHITESTTEYSPHSLPINEALPNGSAKDTL